MGSHSGTNVPIRSIATLPPRRRGPIPHALGRGLGPSRPAGVRSVRVESPHRQADSSPVVGEAALRAVTAVTTAHT